MNENTRTRTAESTETNEKAAALKSIVDAVFDLGIAWAEVGLAQGKVALESSARALTRTAKTLGDLETALKTEPAKTEEPKAA